jgi:hypothetical protein
MRARCMAGSCQDSEAITINPGTTMPGSNDRNRTIYQRLAAVYDLAARVPPTPLRVSHHETGSRLADIIQLTPSQN